ncbi:UDP-glucose:undecaprenyl-phosphate glucose-1-phosphate transferase [Geobacter sp. OR-1]|uniref:undecaprenyl-phosphate glucose phosphotransferase n=1 Tax=Geobacter sp. OR-1 TaxID=1266765 RepID=UPI00054342A7|nr:undecaprenyl-phosphate glucose phosphotransferase [Geobacter sp. OR-1]GAM08212.1 UDP-glucose:undecaprenyl-phosphate glucose-1-phosphate transferase [Geobacter sp. OR-1]
MIRQYQKLFNSIQVLLDAVIIAYSYLVAGNLSIDGQFKQQYGLNFYSVLLWLIPMLLCVYAYRGLYSPMRNRLFRKEAILLIRAHLLGTILIFSIFYLVELTLFSPRFRFLFCFVSLVLLLAERAVVRRTLNYLRKRGYNQKHMLIIGAGSVGEKFAAKIRSHRAFGYTLIGFLDDDVSKIGEKIAGSKVIGGCDLLTDTIQSTLVDEVIVALPLSAYGRYAYIIDCCEREGIRLRILFDYFDLIPGYPKIENFDGTPLLNIRHVPLDDPLNRLLKRVFDLVVASFAIIITSPLMIVIAVLIKASSSGPVFFSQERIGLNNRPFQMLKFRSMKVMEESVTNTRWTTENDPRKTRIGSILRRTSLDELPQFFNVFVGSMSVVGPRPERPFFVEQFKNQVPKYMVKHQVKPGITGWAQVNGWRGDTSIEKRIECDIYYIENWDIFFDLKIMLMTFFRGLINNNAY